MLIEPTLLKVAARSHAHHTDAPADYSVCKNTVQGQAMQNPREREFKDHVGQVETSGEPCKVVSDESGVSREVKRNAG
jgi:hypothetical protein